MPDIDPLIFVAHLAFWLAFGFTRIVASRSAKQAAAQPHATVSSSRSVAPFSRAAVALHMVAFGVMYFGLSPAITPHAVPHWFQGQQLVGLGLILLAAGLACWAVSCFQSWRFEAKLDAGHQLATQGPFRFVRHPIYTSLMMLALGSLVWVPTSAMWVALGLMMFGSEVRARLEERLLVHAFGQSYSNYRLHTKRFIPAIY